MKRAVSAMDMLAEYEELLPGLKAALRMGLSAEEIYVEAQALCAAKGVQIALTERDSAKALSAIRDVLDRTQGKAKERREHTHRLQELPDEQLDAILKTKIQDVTGAAVKPTKATKH